MFAILRTSRRKGRRAGIFTEGSHSVIFAGLGSRGADYTPRRPDRHLSHGSNLMTYKLECHGSTHVGQVREKNEDQFLIADLAHSLQNCQTSLPSVPKDGRTGNSAKLLAVADGMGGHASGERASALVIEQLAQSMQHAARLLAGGDAQQEGWLQQRWEEVLRECQQAIATDVEAHPERMGMGTTLTLALFHGGMMDIVHAGDSRCYLQRTGGLRQLTRDHTLAQLYQEEAPQDAEDDLLAEFGENVLWNVLGGEEPDLVVDVQRIALQPGDVILLCTDGLTKHLADQDLVTILAQTESAQAICQQCITDAIEAGGVDNITVAVARVVETESAPTGATTVPGGGAAPPTAGDTAPYVPQSGLTDGRGEG